MTISFLSRLAARPFAPTLALLASTWLAGGCGDDPSPPPTPSAPAASTTNPPGASAPTPASAAAAPSALPADAPSKLVGRWLRADGGYVIEIRSADPASGKLEAIYLNPNPIHVGSAEAKQENGKLNVVVVLQDVNYPGSTYRLNYFPQTDQLYGTYYQATLGQSFDVEFQRMK